MDFFENKIKERVDDMPSWVKATNGSHKAYLTAEKLFNERMLYIQKHNLNSHYRNKKSYQISGSEVASIAKISKPTLLSTSSYSEAFKVHLAKLNEELKRAKEDRLNSSKRIRSRGPIARPKDELVNEVAQLKKQVAELQRLNAIDQVESAFSRLGPEIRTSLGFGSPAKGGANVVHLNAVNKSN